MVLGPPLVPLSELDSAFQLQEHLKSLYHIATTATSSPNHILPITRTTATSLATPPPGIARGLWLYELCRFLVQRANRLVVDFFADGCSAVNCPEMRASEWQYLCAVHDPPKSCCAIDYCCHTLDWAANVLTSQKHFPSRLTLGPTGKEGSTSQSGDATSVRQLTNIFRRVYRMFAHAWFQHRNVFWAIENEEGLYMFYKTVCDVYSLIPEDNYTIPPEAEGLEEQEFNATEWTRESLHGTSAAATEATRSSRPSSLDLNRATPSIVAEDHPSTQNQDAQPVLSTGATTRRHKHTPSTGSFVTTIHEGDEDSPSTTSSFNITPDIQSLDIADPQNTTAQAPRTARLLDGNDKQLSSTNKDESKGLPSEHQDAKALDLATGSDPSTVTEPTTEENNTASATAGKDLNEAKDPTNETLTDETHDQSAVNDTTNKTGAIDPENVNSGTNVAAKTEEATEPEEATAEDENIS